MLTTASPGTAHRSGHPHRTRDCLGALDRYVDRGSLPPGPDLDLIKNSGLDHATQRAAQPRKSRRRRPSKPARERRPETRDAPDDCRPFALHLETWHRTLRP